MFIFIKIHMAGKEWKIEHVTLSASDGINDSQANVTVIWQNLNVDDDGIFIRVYDLFPIVFRHQFSNHSQFKDYLI